MLVTILDGTLDRIWTKKLFASDHFGLMATFKFKEKSEIKRKLIV